MNWNIIDTYLANVGKAVGVPRANLILLREVHKANPIIVTKDNCDWGYLKPDAGFVAIINHYVVRDAAKGEIITSWGLYEFPSCCAFCVSTQAYVEPKYRGKGVNKLSNQLRQDIARWADYTALICTDVKTNVAERKTLVANGFTDIYEIRNKRTGHEVIISVKAL